MIIGKTHRSNPTVQIPQPYDMHDDPTANVFSPFSVNHHSNAVSPTSDKYSALDALTALLRHLPSNMNNHSPEVEDYDIPLDAFASDHFRNYEFKVRRCERARSHDWTECPYAHPGEKARRRDPRKVHYSGTACPEFRKGFCVRGDACEHAHGVFECWLHPTRYRTQPCKDGTLCRRKVCFFAHTADQLRLLSPSSPRNGNVFVTESYDGSSSRLGIDSLMRETSFGSSPTSTLYSHPLSPPNESPPMSPCGSLGFNSVSELTESMKSMHMAKASRMSMSPPSWGVQIGFPFWSTRHCSTLRPGMKSVPVTPTREMTQSGLTGFDMRDQSCEEEPAMERVESGRDLRSKMYAKLSKENSLDRVDSPGSGSEFGWVSELVN